MAEVGSAPDRRHCWPLSARGLFRPIFTFTLGFILLTVSAAFVHYRYIEGALWFTTWMQVLGMMIAFFFGERSALKAHDPELERRGGGVA